MDEVQIEQWKKAHTQDERRRWFILASRFGYVHGHYETERVGQKLEVAFAVGVAEEREACAKEIEDFLGEPIRILCKCGWYTAIPPGATVPAQARSGDAGKGAATT